MSKPELRRKYRAIRKAYAGQLSAAERRAEAEAVRHRIEQATELPGTIAGYAAMASEPDIGPALEHWRRAGHTTALPFFDDRESPMRFCAYDDLLVPGPFGVDQPMPGNAAVTPGLILVPLVAADRAGNRIGQGAGHYDRALAASRESGSVTAIGICWACQIAESLPADPWDQPLDLIVTPTRMISIA